ncbi:acylneuraminate cytidylyltransferase family protein [Serratia fonticola]|uniref:acylneuraminate cytidylyltransferase family protein n=1 Tax=Serratia fonticola TaxID=47917 RepID=UPI001644BC62|nr:acylneuraminate cytidylyltransferase family protein [Serratia fonticola]MBC3229578.1 acylneuraminate cytidylyltransferase family protein [Serratia fonticola]
MINSKRVLAIIPARGGSKRLPNKNILPLGGKPLIKWSIDSALKSNLIDTVLVTSDSDEILSCCGNDNRLIKLKRKVELSTDTAKTIDVVINAIEFLAEKENYFDIVVLLQPTSPLRTTSHIDESLQLFDKEDAMGVQSVCECAHSPVWCNVLDETLSLNNFIKSDYIGVRSQDLETYYRINGAIYIYNIKELIIQNAIFFSPRVYAYKMNSIDSVDIDNKIDFEFADFLIKKQQ